MKKRKQTGNDEKNVEDITHISKKTKSKGLLETFSLYHERIFSLLNNIKNKNIGESVIINTLSGIFDNLRGILLSNSKQTISDLSQKIKEETTTTMKGEIPSLVIYDCFMEVLQKIDSILRIVYSKRLVSAYLNNFIVGCRLKLFFFQKQIYERLINLGDSKNSKIHKIKLDKSNNNDNEEMNKIFLGIVPFNSNHKIDDENIVIGHHSFAISAFTGKKITLDEISVSVLTCFANCNCSELLHISCKKEKKRNLFTFTFKDFFLYKCNKHSNNSSLFLLKDIKGLYRSGNEKIETVSNLSTKPTFLVPKNLSNFSKIGTYIHFTYFLESSNQSQKDSMLRFNILVLLNIIHSNFFSLEFKERSHDLFPFSTAMILMSSLIERYSFVNYSHLSNMFFSISFALCILLQKNQSFRDLWARGLIWLSKEVLYLQPLLLRDTSTKIFILSCHIENATLSVIDLELKQKIVLYSDNWNNFLKNDFNKLIKEYIPKKQSNILSIKREIKYTKEFKQCFQNGLGFNKSLMQSYLQKVSYVKSENILK